jgi:hypothetical protein
MLKHFKRHPEQACTERSRSVEGQRETHNISILYTLLIVSLLSLLMISACDDPTDLGAVSGVQGIVEFDTIWPDSVKSAVVVIFDKDLTLDSIDVAGYSVVSHFVTFGDPINPGTEMAEYFIQLAPGDYYGMVVGLLLEPAKLLSNDELFQNIQDYIVVPETSFPRGIRILEKQINEQDNWFIRF